MVGMNDNLFWQKAICFFWCKSASEESCCRVVALEAIAFHDQESQQLCSSKQVLLHQLPNINAIFDET